MISTEKVAKCRENRISVYLLIWELPWKIQQKWDTLYIIEFVIFFYIWYNTSSIRNKKVDSLFWKFRCERFWKNTYNKVRRRPLHLTTFHMSNIVRFENIDENRKSRFTVFLIISSEPLIFSQMVLWLWSVLIIAQVVGNFTDFVSLNSVRL